ncbi:MAG: DNA primase [Deltaproteobacteria bacterium]|nr:DNA primase [Deltaproteobacteria bacterium]
MAIFVPEEKIFEIKNTADIVEVVSETVLLKKTGKNYLGLCPFHSEKTPSFTVNSEKQIFYCFGCGAGGNVFSFVMKQENLSFPEAAHMLARRYGIEVPTQTMSPQQKKSIGERDSLFEINKQAVAFFCNVLSNSTAGEKARVYLKKRGMAEDIINGFNLGYAPVGWDNLVNFFSKKRIPEVLVEKSGLIVARNKNHTQRKNGFYDRFRDRIIFPVFDVSMRVIGFGGRVLDDSLPKYLNSPETPLYNKSRSVYGLHKAKQKCRETNTVYIVEGYFDLLSLFQHGISNAVATLGTSLTVEHVRLLKGYAGRFVLVYDSDEAGIKAAQRSIDIFMKEGVDVRIIVLPEGYDPDSYLLEFGSGSFEKAAGNALGVMPFLMKSAVKKHGFSIEGKINIMSDLKAPLAAISDSVARSLYIKKAAELIDIDETAVLEKIRNVSAEKKLRVRRGFQILTYHQFMGKQCP